MTIKALAFEVQSSLSRASGVALKRSHAHEVLAALFGFASYAALTQHLVLAQHDGSAPEVLLDLQRAAGRAAELGYLPPGPPLIAAATASAVEAARIYVIPLEAVLYQLGIEFDEIPRAVVERLDEKERNDDGMFFALDVGSTVLRESLTRLADGGSALAHFALARLYEETLTDMSEEGGDGRFWFEQQQRGRQLNGVEIEWAAAYGVKQDALTSRQDHLRRAVELGNAEAALRQVEIDPTDANFDQAARLAGVRQAARLAHVALFLGRDEDAAKVLRVLASNGDTTAMKQLAGGLETNLKEAWTWVHLAKLLGVDVMAYDAVGEDGLSADADEPGPIYAAGGFHLDSLPNDEALEALQVAHHIYAKLVARGQERVRLRGSN